MIRLVIFLISLFLSSVMPAQAGSFREFILQETANVTKVIELDHASQQCMSCHNGKSGKHIYIKDADSPMIFSNTGSSNHPVGMSYLNYVREQPYNFNDPSTLGDEIKLVDGRVGCLSCHRLNDYGKMKSEVEQSRIARLNDSCESSSQVINGFAGKGLCATCHKI